MGCLLMKFSFEPVTHSLLFISRLLQIVFIHLGKFKICPFTYLSGHCRVCIPCVHCQWIRPAAQYTFRLNGFKVEKLRSVFFCCFISSRSIKWYPLISLVKISGLGCCNKRANKNKQFDKLLIICIRFVFINVNLIFQDMQKYLFKNIQVVNEGKIEVPMYW